MYYIYTQLMVTHTQTPYIIKPYSLEGLLLLLVLLCQKQTTEFSAAFSKRYKSALLRSIIPANQKQFNAPRTNSPRAQSRSTSIALGVARRASRKASEHPETKSPGICCNHIYLLVYIV